MHKSLKLEEIKYLISKKFKEVKQIGVSGKKEHCLLKPRFNETIEHSFLVYNIAEYLKKFTKKIELYETAKPDIVFENNKKSYAIEIETGSLYKKARKQLYEKVEQLKKDYPTKWCFVVTNEKLAPVYNSLGKTFTRKTFVKQFTKWLTKT